MRIIIYSVFNKTTNQRLYANCRKAKCEEFVGKSGNKNDLVICYKWMSF